MLEDELWMRQREKPSLNRRSQFFENWTAETEFSVFEFWGWFPAHLYLMHSQNMIVRCRCSKNFHFERWLRDRWRAILGDLQTAVILKAIWTICIQFTSVFARGVRKRRQLIGCTMVWRPDSVSASHYWSVDAYFNCAVFMYVCDCVVYIWTVRYLLLDYCGIIIRVSTNTYMLSMLCCCTTTLVACSSQKRKRRWEQETVSVVLISLEHIWTSQLI